MRINREMFNNIRIDTPSSEMMNRIRHNWDTLSKPIDGLGDYESAICRIGAIKNQESPTLKNKYVIVMCADNGIVEEGVTQTDKQVTAIVASLLGEGKSTLNTLARRTGAIIVPVDIGIDTEDICEAMTDDVYSTALYRPLLNKKVRRGTRNFLKEEALTETEVLDAIGVGIDMVKELGEAGADIIATGEMGIGNTTTTSALLSLITGIDPNKLVGRGAGLSHEGLATKKRVVSEAVNKYKKESLSDDAEKKIISGHDSGPNMSKEQTLYYLRAVGGLDIAGLVGVFIGGAIHHIPIVIDGVISAVAALVANILAPGAVEYMLPSHRGREEGTMIALGRLGLTPYINGNMALGEGTGAVMLFPLLDMVLDLYSNGITFNEGNIEQYERFT